MDEASGRRAANSLGGTANNIPGTLTNFTFNGTTNGWATGHTGNGLLFGGTQYVAGSDTPLPSGNDPLSLSAWVYMPSVNSHHFVMSYGTASNYRSIDIYSGQLWFYPQFTPSAQVIPANAWTHIAVTYDGSTVTTYVNGSYVASGTIAALSTSLGAYYLGEWVGQLGSSFRFTGTIDDVRIYNTALSALDISSLYSGTAPPAQSPNLVGYWNLDESSGTVAHDASAACGLLQNFAYDGSDGWTSGNFGNALLFKQSNADYVTLPDPVLPRGSVEMWINPTTLTGDQRLFSQASGAITQAGTLAMNQSSGESGSLWVWDGAAWQRLSDSGSLSAGSWNHVVVDYSGSSATAFVNGAQTLYVAPTRFDFSGVGVSLGGKSFGSGGNTYNGALDDVRVSSALLNDYEVADHYRKGL